MGKHHSPGHMPEFNPSQHPRDWRGRFTRSHTFAMSAGDRKELSRIQARFTGKSFDKPETLQAWQKAEGGKHRAPEEAETYRSSSFAQVNETMRAGKGDDDPTAQAIKSAMQPTGSDLVAHRDVPIAKFGKVDPEALEGMGVADATFTPASLRPFADASGGRSFPGPSAESLRDVNSPDATPSAPVAANPNGHVHMTMDVPKGTKAIAYDDGDLLLEDDLPMSVDSVDRRPDGDYDMHLTVLPKDTEGHVSDGDTKDSATTATKSDTGQGDRFAQPASSDRFPAPGSSDRFAAPAKIADKAPAKSSAKQPPMDDVEGATFHPQPEGYQEVEDDDLGAIGSIAPTDDGKWAAYDLGDPIEPWAEIGPFDTREEAVEHLRSSAPTGPPGSGSGSVESGSSDTSELEHDDPGAAEVAGRLDDWHHSAGYSAEQRQALSDYSGRDYDQINSVLRGSSSPDDDVEQQIDHISEAMSPTPFDMTVYRGASFEALNVGSAAELRGSVGSVVSDAGFTSTSIAQTVAEGFGGDVRMRISVPKGTPAAWLEPLSRNQGEFELLLNAGIPMVIRSVSDDEVPVVELAVVG